LTTAGNSNSRKLIYENGGIATGAASTLTPTPTSKKGRKVNEKAKRKITNSRKPVNNDQYPEAGTTSATTTPRG